MTSISQFLAQPSISSGQRQNILKCRKDIVEHTLKNSNKFLGINNNNSSPHYGAETTNTAHQHKQNVDPDANSNISNHNIDMDPDFDSMFHPNDMRLLALVSHNNMKHAMKQFVIANKNVLKKFRLTGTNTTMTMLQEVFADDSEVVYGPSCRSGPLGGDAQLVAMAATGQLGGCIFFVDPMDAHPHSADIGCLNRQGNVHNVLMMHNPTTAQTCMNALRMGLKLGRIEMMPSFFFDLESPSVEAYKKRQQSILENAVRRDHDEEIIAPSSSGPFSFIKGSTECNFDEVVSDTEERNTDSSLSATCSVTTCSSVTNPDYENDDVDSIHPKEQVKKIKRIKKKKRRKGFSFSFRQSDATANVSQQ